MIRIFIAASMVLAAAFSASAQPSAAVVNAQDGHVSMRIEFQDRGDQGHQSERRRQEMRHELHLQRRRQEVVRGCLVKTSA